jgi:stage V sporulation protein D (sporulation-specific penicillin-binding protein)
MEPTLNAIVKCFSVDRKLIEERINQKPNSLYEEIPELKNLKRGKVDEFKEMREKNSLIKGVWFKESYIRRYPMKTVASNIVGFVNRDNIGTYGIEGQYNEELNGTKGRSFGYFDTEMNLKRTVKPAVNGETVILTIDANVQKIVENMIAEYQKTIQAKNMGVVLMNPENGQILAMASNSIYNLNRPDDLKVSLTPEEIEAMSEEEKKNKMLQLWSNYCISAMYEPGSTFKPFTVAAALDEGKVTEASTFHCDGGLQVADRRIHCVNVTGHGTLTLEQTLMESCNVALMEIGRLIGRDKFYNYNQLFGFGNKTGIALPGEATGLLHEEDQLNPVELATSSFGQTQTVTMIQMITGFCSLINGGNYYQPQIVKELQNDEEIVVQNFEPVLLKKTVTEETSKLIRKFMLSTVEGGSANPVKVKGYSIGGKTGTAEKQGRDKTNYLLSFLGAVPANDPKVAVYVVIDQPLVEEQAHSIYATEFTSKLLKRVLPFLGVDAK